MSKKTNTKSKDAQSSAKASTGQQKNTSWYQQGQQGFDRKRQLDQQAALRKEKGVPRFLLSLKEVDVAEAKIVFVDSVFFWIWEHQLEINGKWGNYFTCTKDFEPCMICNQGDNRSTYTGYLTVIDTRAFTFQGKEYKNRKVLFPAKGSAAKILEDLAKRHKDLRGMVFEVKRYSKEEPNCGAHFERVGTGKVDFKKISKDAHVPYDYKKILAPPTEEELAAIGMGSSQIVGSEADLKSAADVDVTQLL